eukprot:SAG22_NODE_71_length_22540_cov_8.918052_11_plen_83_part_00
MASRNRRQLDAAEAAARAVANVQAALPSGVEGALADALAALGGLPPVDGSNDDGGGDMPRSREIRADLAAHLMLNSGTAQAV